MQKLYETYGQRIANMAFWWYPGKGGRRGEWIPSYIISTFTNLRSVWEEWDQGKEGCLPIKEIEGVWGTKWRPRQGSEMARLGGEVGSTLTYIVWMKTIEKLVLSLAKEMDWREVKVINFLDSRFPKGPRDLAVRITKKEGGHELRKELFAAARRWNGIV
jgi:hypothetical protein